MTELTNGDLGKVEYLLKRELAKRMGSIQEDRIAGPAGSANVGNARDYVETARTLRRVLLQQGRQTYKPVRDIHGAGEWIGDETKETADVDTRDTVIEAAEKLQRIKNPNFEPITLTDHSNVPG